MLLIMVDGREVFIGGKDHELAMVTGNTRRVVWMYLFTQPMNIHPGTDLHNRSNLQGWQIFDSLDPLKEAGDGKRSMDEKQHY